MMVLMQFKAISFCAVGLGPDVTRILVSRKQSPPHRRGGD